MTWIKVIGFVGLCAVLGAWAYMLIADQPRLPINAANGTYFNPCCGNLVMSDGKMTVSHRRVTYVIERDKVGPYALPKIYVGASEAGFVVKPGGFPMMLRLDASSSPRTIELIDDRPGGGIYSFARSNGS